MLSLEDLRRQHPRFFFNQVDVQLLEETLTIRLGYQFENGPALETIYQFPDYSTELLASKDTELIKLWATHLGMVEGMSYWKAACSPTWVIDVPGILPEQITFWEQLIKKGLSEFFFINNINGWAADFLRFEITTTETTQAIKADSSSHQERILIPVGGGKDSIVTTELLRQLKLPISTFSVNLYPQLEQVVNTFWQASPTPRNHIMVQRHLDPGLSELNQQGYLNGHTPFSAMVAFASTLAAYLYDYKYVPLSNEWSANEGNTVFLGETINHQYSKTIEFEKVFRSYQQQYLSSTVEYFSFLRPLHELQIAKLFTSYPQYWPVFLSCNRGQKKGEWCGECPKCLFVAVMLAAFLPLETINGIFHKDILNDLELQPIFDELAGFTEVKSLECVGTRDETRSAVALASKNLQPLPALLDYGWQRLLSEGNTPGMLLQKADQLLENFVSSHYLPTQFEQLLQQTVKAIKGSDE